MKFVRVINGQGQKYWVHDGRDDGLGGRSTFYFSVDDISLDDISLYELLPGKPFVVAEREKGAAK